MAYKVSYKVVSEQGQQLKTISKDMDNYISQLNQIVSKLGNDELLQSVRADLNKFKQQLEEEKTVLNLAGQVIVDVVQSYTGVEKKSVQKVDKAKAHNRDFYKRPVAVASAGGAATATATAGGAASVNVSASSVYQSSSSTTVYSSPVVDTAGAVSAGSAAMSGVGAVASELTGKGASIGGIAAAVGSVAVAGGAVVGADMMDKKKADKKEAEEKDDSQ